MQYIVLIKMHMARHYIAFTYETLTVKSLYEEYSADAVEEESVDNVLSVVLNVLLEVLESQAHFRVTLSLRSDVDSADEAGDARD